MKFKWVNNEVVLIGTPHVRMDERGHFHPEAHTNGAVSVTSPDSYGGYDAAYEAAKRMAATCTTFLGWHRRTTTKGLILRMDNYPSPKRVVGPFASQEDLDAYVAATLSLEEPPDA